MNLEIQHKNALVCGSTQGIGKATAIGLAAEGVNVTLIARNEEKLKEAVTKFQDFANTFPDDERAPEFLLKASDFSNALKLPEKSGKILDRIIKDYPEYEKMEDIYYVRAVYLDFDLRDTTRAKEAYQTYIDKYPNSGQRVLDAQTRIDNIAYSIEELAEKFIQELEAQ